MVLNSYLDSYYKLYPEQVTRLNALGDAYELKKDLLEEFQQGKHLDPGGVIYLRCTHLRLQIRRNTIAKKIRM